MIVFDLRDLSAFSSSSRVLLAACSEAASVVLWTFQKPPRTLGQWENNSGGRGTLREDPVEVSLVWDEPEQAILKTHGNEKDATEYGAYAVAIALADHLGFKVLGRAHQGSGTDWLMIRKGEPANDYYKLEVSGMARINKERPENRLERKVAQGSGGDLQRPGIAVVVRFEDAQILSETWR
ncbi:hypothetical protein WME94_53130 [Sorangium sp. So ce429]